MARFSEVRRYAALALFTLLTGCALPAGERRAGAEVGEPTSAASVSSPTVPANAREPRPEAPVTPAASRVAYQAAADAAAEPVKAAGGDAPGAEQTAQGTAQPMPAPVQPQQETSTPSPDAPPIPDRSDDPSDPFAGRAELPVDQLVAEVQSRNPSIQAASSAWRAAADRYPQVISLDDPMFTYMVSPSGVGMDNGGGWMAQASQKVPWAGKRALRGSAALAEADVMKGDIGDARLRLAEAARTAFYDYYLAKRELDVNASTRQILTQFREIALNKYQVGQAMEQDVLQADVELAGLETRRAELARDEQVAVARINTLLHREANHPLPPPPAKVALPDALPAVEPLQQSAVQSRPDLFALHARVRAEQANLALACKEYYPDVNLVAKYDGFMPEEMRPQVGMDLNIPIRYSRRSAAVSEAQSRVAQRYAEYQDRLDQVRYEVQSALSRAAQSRQVVGLYEQKILPAAQRSLDSAMANYTSGKLDFLRLLDAERQLNTQREMYYQTIAEYHRRVAELERAVGQPVVVAR
ncbi:MAG: TolC family protein [Pirellulales bacterium]